MQEDRFGGPPSTIDEVSAPMDPAALVSTFLSTTGALSPAGYLGSRAEVEKELDLVAAAMRTFFAKPPDMVMRECSAYTARLTEMAVLLHRKEGESRQWTRVRTQQVQRFLDELDRQWKTASRLIEVSRQDLQVLRGQV
jgi:hypothetical protein